MKYVSNLVSQLTNLLAAL